MTWTELIEDFLADQPDWADKTRNYYRTRLRGWGGFLAESGVEPGEIEAGHINRYLGRLREEGYSWSTRNGSFTAIRAFCGWLAKRGLLENDPFRDPDSGLKRPRKRRQVVRDVPLAYARRMIAAAEDATVEGCAQHRLWAMRDVAIMRLLISTGMRREEVVKLRLADLDLDDGWLRVIRGKGGHERVGVLTAAAIAALERWLEVRPRTRSQAVFLSLRSNKRGINQQLRPDAINDVLIKWRDRAGLPPVSVSPHKWRHAFGVAMARAKNLYVLQELMGHSDIQTTKIYVNRVDRETLRKMVDEYGPDC